MHLMSTINERNEYHLQVGLNKSFYRWPLEVRTRKKPNTLCIAPFIYTYIYTH